MIYKKAIASIVLEAKSCLFKSKLRRTVVNALKRSLKKSIECHFLGIFLNCKKHEIFF